MKGQGTREEKNCSSFFKWLYSFVITSKGGSCSQILRVWFTRFNVICFSARAPLIRRVLSLGLTTRYVCSSDSLHCPRRRCGNLDLSTRSSLSSLSSFLFLSDRIRDEIKLLHASDDYLPRVWVNSYSDLTHSSPYFNPQNVSPHPGQAACSTMQPSEAQPQHPDEGSKQSSRCKI